MTIDPSELDAADTDVVNPDGWDPDLVDAEPDENEVTDLDEEADS